MNELQQLNKDKVKNERQAEQEKQNVLIGRIRPRRGHTLFEINEKTGEIKEADFISETIEFTKVERGDYSPRKRVQVNHNCKYISALNKKNALKKYNDE